MTPERWQQVKAVFQQALERDTNERSTFVAQACGSDDALRSEVTLLLDGHANAASFIETPAHEVAADFVGAQTSLVGQQLNHYQILAPLGKGGMGEVYQAHDTKLDRTVALKILPADVALDAERMRRFTREAKAASALNHPHVATIYEIGEVNDIHFIAMEYVEGQTLAAKINGTPLAINELIEIGSQIADALDEAHSKGITHRDIKPANVMLTPRGQVKVLDFGLAKITRPQSIDSNISTLAQTQSGVVMGTPQYMSPEQVRGQKADHRSDIFSFGVLLYEMLSGQRPFQGKSLAETMAAIANEEPPELSSLNSKVPAPLERILKRCLEKQPESRFQSASDLGFALEALSTTSESQPNIAAMPENVGRWRLFGNSRLAWGITILAVLGLLTTLPFVISYLRQTTPANDQLTMLSVNIPANTSLISLALSPDGYRLALTIKEGAGQEMIYLRQFDAENLQKLEGTEGASFPFWSPDSRSIGFFARGKLQKIHVSGGLPQIICERVGVDGTWGGTWNRDGVIIVGTRTGGLFKAPATGGEPSPLTTSDQPNDFKLSHRYPLFLPDGRSFLYYSNGAIYLGSLDGIETKKLFRADASVIYTPPGYLLFQRQGTMMAQAFDPQKLITRGEPFPMSQLLGTVSTHHGYQLISNSHTGMLAYHKSDKSQLIWFNRGGSRIGEIAFEGDYDRPSISHDGRIVAFEGFNPLTPGRDIWLLDLSRGIPTRFTSDPGPDEGPVWSPDGSRIVFASKRGSYYETFQKAVNSAGKSEPLFNFGSINAPNDWSLDGRFIAFWTFDPKTKDDIWILPLEGDRKPFPLLHTEFSEKDARFSPNGKWIAYSSNESGRGEIYVQRFPDLGNKVQVSTAGGANPEWRRDGRELFYLAADSNLMSVEVKTDGVFEASVPRPLFRIKSPRVATQNYPKLYTVTPDGQRFLVRSVVSQEDPLAINILTNWEKGLKR